MRPVIAFTFAFTFEERELSIAPRQCVPCLRSLSLEIGINLQYRTMSPIRSRSIGRAYGVLVEVRVHGARGVNKRLSLNRHV